MIAATRKSKSQTTRKVARAKTTRGTAAKAGKGKPKRLRVSEYFKVVPIAKIGIGNRYRQDFGDLEKLAENIQELGLLQPIGITEENKLVFGERRIQACRDFLGWKTIPALIVHIRSILAGEYSENEMRKDFTPSERVAIAKALQQEIGERRGNPSIRLKRDELDGRTDDAVAKKAGFHDRNAYRRAKKVVEKGYPSLIEAMDSEKVSITAAARLADLPKEKQNELLDLDLDARKLRQAAAKLQSNSHVSGTSGKQREAVFGTHDWVMAIVADLKNHWKMVETILTPICDEQRDVKLKHIEKRVLVGKLREIKDIHRDLERALLAAKLPNR